MKKWLIALRSETVISVWWVLSALSTISTFFIPNLAGRWRLVSAVSAVIGFAVANFKAFQKQENRISILEKALASHNERRSQLKISSDNRSRYILQPVMPDVRQADFKGGYFEFHLMIENGGPRNSTVNNYKIERSTRQACPSGILPTPYLESTRNYSNRCRKRNRSRYSTVLHSRYQYAAVRRRRFTYAR